MGAGPGLTTNEGNTVVYRALRAYAVLTTSGLLSACVLMLLFAQLEPTNVSKKATAVSVEKNVMSEADVSRLLRAVYKKEYVRGYSRFITQSGRPITAHAYTSSENEEEMSEDIFKKLSDDVAERVRETASAGYINGYHAASENEPIAQYQ